jgi:hypothetical protein
MRNRLNLVKYGKIFNISFCISIVWITKRIFIESDFEYVVAEKYANA